VIWEGNVASDIIVIASIATFGAVDDCVIIFWYWVCVFFLGYTFLLMCIDDDVVRFWVERQRML